ncbi:phage tail tape measure protein [uncultured Robinsoniella sp.]|uniref:phage tail tape measure protein n=1 Tax=uncultured Robinsoniella sp. TaxID=904190 RepID=UPI00290EF6C2|nr:phage tail tape measure protein [Clostridiales bacterium]
MGRAKIAAGIALDGEKEFKSAVSNINKSLTTMKSELNLVKAECEGEANTLQSLGKKHEVLNKILDQHKAKVKAASDGLNNAKNAYDKIGTNLQEYKKNLEQAEKKMEEMKKSSNTTDDALKKQEQSIKDLSASVKKGEENYTKAENRVKEWQKSLNTAETQVIKASKEVDKNASYMREAEQATDHCAQSINEFGKEVKNAGQKLEEAGNETERFGDVLKANLAGRAIAAGAEALTNLGKEALSAATDTTKAANQMQASTGASAEVMEQYKAVMEDVYKGNFGESLDDVANAAVNIVHNMGEISGESLKETTEDAITLRDTFDMDLNETIRGANGLIKNMGLDATEAFDYMAKGAQKGLNKTGELGDNLAEYTQIWGQAGFEAKEMFAILQNGLDSGAYNLDKVNDLVKEFGVSLVDGRIEAGLSNFSEGTENLFYKWKDGSATTADVFQSVIADLSNMANKQDALTIASGTWSALGEDNALKVINSLNEVNNTYDNVKGTMESVKDIKYDDIGSQIAEIGRTMQLQIAEPLAKDILPVARDGLKMIAENLGAVKTGVAGFGSALALNKFGKSDLYKSAAAGLMKMTTATEGATLAQKALNIVTGLSPIGKLVGVISLVTAAAVAFKIATGDSKTEMQEQSETVNDLCRRTDELTETVQSNNKAREESKAAVESEWGANQMLADELFNLAEKEGKTNEEKAYMQSLVSQLNESIPNLNLAYNEQTGELNQTREAVDKYIESLEKQALVAAAEDDIKNIMKERYEATKLLNEATEEKNTIDQKVIDKQKAIQDVAEQYTKEMRETGQSAIDASALTQQYTNEITQCYDESDKLSKKIKEQQDVLDGTDTKLNSAKEALGEYKESTDSAAEAAGNLGDAVQGTSETFATAAQKMAEEAAAAVEEIQTKYSEMQTSIEQSVQGSISALDEFDGGTKITKEKVLENLNSQIEGLTGWSDNMRILAAKGGEGMTSEIYEYLTELGPKGANLVQTLVNMSEDEFRQASQKWTTALNLPESISKEFTLAQAELSGEMDILESTTIDGAKGISESLSKIDASKVSESLKKSMQGAADAIKQSGGTVSESAKSAFNAAVDAAGKAGAEIPVELSANLANGSTSIADATNVINTSVQAKMTELQQKMSAMGIQLPQEIQVGIEQGTVGPVQAIQAMNAQIEQEQRNAQTASVVNGQDMTKQTAQGMESQSQTVKDAATNTTKGANDSAYALRGNFLLTGSGFATGMSEGIANGSPAVGLSAGNAASAANASAGSYRQTFNGTGYNLSAGLADGIRSGEFLAVNAAVAVVGAAADAARRKSDQHSPSRVWRNQIGINLPKGLALGILDGKKEVMSSAAEICKAALAASTTELDIHSPSKKFEKAVGAQIVNGMIFGIKGKKVSAVKEGKKLSRSVYESATSWLSAYKKTNDMSLEDEKYFWKRISKIVMGGSTQYKEAKKKGADITAFQKEMNSKLSNLGVSWNKNDKKKTQKSAEEYYSDVFKEAKKYFENYESEHKVSLQQEKYYWEQVKKHTEAGTQGYYDAAKKVKAVQKEIDKEVKNNKAKQKEKEQARSESKLSNSDKLIGDYKMYRNVSAKAEMQYWEIVRKQFKAGTNERLEADQKYFEAKSNLTDQLKDLENDYLEKSLEVNKELEDSVKSLNEEYANAVKDRADSIYSSFGLFDEFESESESGAKLLYNLKTQVAGISDWEMQLQELGGKGKLSEGLLQELKEMGPEASASIHALNTLSAEQLAEYDKLWQQKKDLSHKQAVDDMEPTRKKTLAEINKLQEDAKKELAALDAEYTKAASALNKGISSELKKLAKSTKKIGDEAVAKLLKGITGGVNSKTAKIELKKTTTTITKGLGDLPKQTTKIGNDALQGIIDGLTNKKKISKSAKNFIAELKKAIEEAADIHSPSRLFKNAIGVQLAAGVGDGITAGTIKATKPATEMISSILQQSKEKMKQQSKELEKYNHSLNAGMKINALNDLISTNPNTGTNSNNQINLQGKMDAILNMMESFFPQFANSQLVLETGALVGETQKQYSNEFAMARRRLR